MGDTSREQNTHASKMSSTLEHQHHLSVHLELTTPTTTTAMAPIHTPFRAPMPSLLQSLRSLTLAPASTTTMSMSRVPSQFCVPARRAFTTTPTIAARKPDKKKLKDPRITLIRYHMQHPKTPRPLRLSRMRALRHWTIHRAWQLARRKKLESQDRELERLVSVLHCIYFRLPWKI
jgi:large subunit ribosomal protein L40